MGQARDVRQAMLRCCSGCGQVLSGEAFCLPDGDDSSTFLLSERECAQRFFKVKAVGDGRSQLCCPGCEGVLGAGFEFPEEPFQLIFASQSTRQLRAGSAELKLLGDLWAERERGKAAARARRILELLEQTLVQNSDRFLTLKEQTTALSDKLESALAQVKELAERAFKGENSPRLFADRSPPRAKPKDKHF